MGICVERLNHLLIECKQENELLKRENSDLRVKNTDLNRETCDLRVKNSVLRVKDSDLREENSDLRVKNADLREENADLRVGLKIVRLETEVEIFRNDSQDSKNIITRIAEQPRINNDTRNTNLVLPTVDTSQETINRAVEVSYNMDHFCSGQKGVARFAVDHLLTNEQKQLGYVCTDPARGTFKHIGEDGEVVRDVKASRLTTKLFRPIKVKASRLAGELTSMDEGNEELASVAYKHYQDVSEMENDNTGFRTELAAVTTQ
jgi:hypothetical protein